MKPSVAVRAWWSSAPNSFRFFVRVALLLPALVIFGSAQSPPTIAKQFGAANIPLNGSTTMTFTVTNPNAATALTNVSFTDTLPSGLIIANPDSLTPDPVLGDCDPTGTTGTITPSTQSISLAGGQIPANATCTFSIDVLAVSGGDQVNTTAPITSTEGGTGGTATATVTVDLPDLTISKAHTGNFRQAQAGAVYTITVTNSGGATTAGPVAVDDSLPTGLTAVSIGGSGWTCAAPPALHCTRADGLDPGNSFADITLTVNVAANAPATVTNSATVSGGGESNTANDTASDPTTVVPLDDLTITKTHTGAFTPGQTGATYTLTVNNIGLGPSVGTVTVTDTLPNVPNTLAPTGMSGTGWTCDLPSLTCTRSDVLAGGASYPPITLTVNVPSNIQANITNTATVSGGGELNTANDTASDQTHIGSPLQIRAQLTNMTVSPGGTTSTIFNVDSSSGLGAITFQCSGLPTGASCSFNPASSTQLSAQITMTLTAAGSSSAALPPANGRMPDGYEGLFALCGLAGLFLAFTAKKRLRTRLALCIAGLAFLLIAIGCGGEGSKNTTTTSGTFPITVTATSASTGTSASTTVSLTVL